MTTNNYETALDVFRKAIHNPETQQDVAEIIRNRDIVLKRYGPIFSVANIHQLTEDDFRSFLYFENNRHWSGLYRHVTSLCEDLDLLRSSLSILLDSKRPLAVRYDEATGQIKGFGKALATAILLVSSPHEYGIWNNTSEKALKQVGLWREFVHGRIPGQQYEQINQLLLRLAKDLEVDLWTLDAMMWGVIPEEEETDTVKTEPIQASQPVPHSFLDDIRHPNLKSRLARLSTAPLDTIIREAGVVFESQFRNKVDPNSMKHGVELIDDALKPGGTLVFSSHMGEQQGVQFLYRGAMQFIRNPPMHKIIDYPEGMAIQFLRLIDALMMILDQAVMADEITVDDIRFMLKRRHIKPNHRELYKILYSAGSAGIEYKELAKAMRLTPQQLSGVLGSLGSRINATEGLEDKGGTLIILDIQETSTGDWCYVMRPILEKALKEEGII